MSFDQDFVLQYGVRASVVPLKMKYAVVDGTRRYDRCIESLSSILGTSGYSGEVRDVLLAKRFRGRVSVNDRVLSTMYYVLKRHRYPISYNDIMPYTQRSSPSFKKILLREFQYVETSDEYLENIFSRTRDLYRVHSLEEETGLGDFIRIAERYRSTDPQLLCIAYFIRNKDVLACYKRYGLSRLANIVTLRKIVRKINTVDVGCSVSSSRTPHTGKRASTRACIKSHFMGRH